MVFKVNWLCLILQQFQRTIVRGVEGFVAVSTKQMEIGKFTLFFFR